MNIYEKEEKHIIHEPDMTFNFDSLLISKKKKKLRKSILVSHLFSFLLYPFHFLGRQSRIDWNKLGHMSKISNKPHQHLNVHLTCNFNDIAHCALGIPVYI